MVLVHYDVKLSGESCTFPHIRVCPFVEESYRMLVSGLLAARSSDSQLTPGTLAILLDGGKSGNRKTMIAPWALPKAAAAATASKEDAAEAVVEGGPEEAEGGVGVSASAGITIRTVVLIKEEESLRARRTLSRGTAVLPQVENILLVCVGPLNLPERQCQVFGGTNRGTVMGPVKTPTTESEWKLTVKDPREDGKRKLSPKAQAGSQLAWDGGPPGHI